MTRVATRRGAYRRGGRVANDPSRSATRGRRGVGREGARAYPRRSRRRGWDSSRGCSCTRTRRRSPRRGTPWRARCGCERGCSPRSSWREAASCRRFGRPRGGRPRSGARARAGGLAGGAANGQRKKARGPSWKKGAPGSATTPERARSLGKEPETGRRDPAIRARSERGGGRRRRRRGRALPRLSRLRRGARPWVWRRARRDRRKRRELADGRSLSRHARRSFVPGRICERGLEISRTTGRAVLIGGGWGRGANAFHRTPIKTTRADRSNRTNHQTLLPRHRHQKGPRRGVGHASPPREVIEASGVRGVTSSARSDRRHSRPRRRLTVRGPLFRWRRAP